MKALLEKRNTIYGACAIWIVVFHVFRRISMPYIPVLTNIICIGNLAVDIFFFFSGLCLSLSVTKYNYPDTGWKPYFKKRLTRILLPYVIVCVPYYFWSAVFETSGSIVRKALVFFANLTSVSFWLKGTQTTWYVYGILIFYCLFPVIHSFVKKSGALQITALLSGMILFATATAYIPVLKNSMIVWARFPVFTIGVVAGTIPDKDRVPNAAQTVVAALIVVLLGCLTSTSELSEAFSFPPVCKFLLFIPLTLALLTLLAIFGKKNRFLEWIGGLSLELYLVHITMLHPLKYYGVIQTLGLWLYLFLPAVSLLLAWVVGLIEKRILKRGAET